MNEWEFTAEVAGWINAFIESDPSLPFSSAKCEQKGTGSSERRDLTLLDKDGRIVLTGEVKLPQRKDGGSPYNVNLVRDARAKAIRAKCNHFFTWNVNELVLWETAPEKTSWIDHGYRRWEITKVTKEDQLDLPPTLFTIRMRLVEIIHDFARILRGIPLIGFKTPDEKLVEALESHLQMPIQFTLQELHSRYKQAPFKSRLDKWMREEQGWIIYDDPEGIQENLERTSKFSCYALLNKIVFHEALLKKYQKLLDKIVISEHIDTGESLRHALQKFFSEAISVTGDYETVFGEESISIGNLIPFYSDKAVSHWLELIEHIHEFDFSKLDYEIIGNLFERLIAPEERQKFGQFYTRVEVVDLINSFCIRDGTESVMDPACGGGTFLVRAYARKRELNPNSDHRERLSALFGVDISHFATHLTTVNLASRDLVEKENYPQIARENFFNVEVGTALLSLPTHVKTKGLDKLDHRPVQIPPLDAVVGNPPYIRQEEIPKSKVKKEPTHGTKEHYQEIAKQQGAFLSGRSDIHCYFWPHATSFLKQDGFLCFLTSTQWLDVEYGFDLQEWILRNFEIVAILESLHEPWFVGARVATAVTILLRQTDERKRMENQVRFVQIRNNLGDILVHDGTTAGAVVAANEFRDEILGLKSDTANNRYRCRLVKQEVIWNQGVHLGVVMGKSAGSKKKSAREKGSQYYGGKWGVHLRAPDLWFQLIEQCKNRLIHLGDLAEIRFGVKSGKDIFFYPIDRSQECLNAGDSPREFKKNFGASREEVQSGKVKLVGCGEERGEIRPIESVFLEPEVHNLMEIRQPTVTAEECKRLVLLVSNEKSNLSGTYVGKYIDWGEERGFHRGSTCASRVSKDREWYDLTGHARGALFWSKSHQYKHVVPVNELKLQCNCNLYDIHPKEDVEPQVLAGVLNSTIVLLSKHLYGRPVGVEGNLKTEIVDVNMMLVPDPRKGTPKAREKVANAFEVLKKRKSQQFLSERRLREMAYTQKGKEAELKNLSDKCELDMDDRWELDNAVLAMIGVKSQSKRTELLIQIYGYLREFFEWTRQKEEVAITNKKTTKRRGPARPIEIAQEIYREIQEKDWKLLRNFDRFFVDIKKPYDVYDIPKEGVPEYFSDMFTANGVEFKKGKKRAETPIKTRHSGQDELIVLVAKAGYRGLVRIPYEKEECRKVIKEFGAFARKRESRLREAIAERTADEEMQEKIYQALMPLVIAHVER